MHGQRGGITSIFLVVAAGSTGFGTGQFLQENMGDGFLARASATVIAFGVAFAIYWLWEFLYGLAPALTTARARLGVLALAAVATLLVTAASALPNAAAISGASAQGMAINHQTVAVERVVAKHGEAAHQLAGVINDCNAVVAKIASYAQAEFERGSISGTPRDGAVHTLLIRLRDQLRDLCSNVQKQQDQAAETLARARDDLAAMRATSGLPVNERMQKVGALADTLRARLAQLDTRPLAASVGRIVAGVPQEVASVAVKLSNDPNVASRQREALDRLQADLAASTQPLATLCMGLAQVAPLDLPGFTPMTGAEAVRIHWRSYIPTFAIVLTLDLFPFFGFLVLLIASASRSRGQQAWHDLAHLSVQDAILSAAANDLLHGKPVDALRALISGELGRGKP